MEKTAFQGKLSTYVIIPLVCIAAVMGAASYFVGSSVPDASTPTMPYQNANQTFIGQNFFTNLNGFIANVNDLGRALQQITPDITNQNPQFFIDTSLAGVAILKIMLGIPGLIVTFIYDVVRIMFFFLPAQPSILFMATISLLVLIPIIYIVMEVASAIRPPGIAKW